MEMLQMGQVYKYDLVLNSRTKHHLGKRKAQKQALVNLIHYLYLIRSTFSLGNHVLWDLVKMLAHKISDAKKCN